MLLLYLLMPFLAFKKKRSVVFFAILMDDGSGSINEPTRLNYLARLLQLSLGCPHHQSQALTSSPLLCVRNLLDDEMVNVSLADAAKASGAPPRAAAFFYMNRGELEVTDQIPFVHPDKDIGKVICVWKPPDSPMSNSSIAIESYQRGGGFAPPMLRYWEIPAEMLAPSKVTSLFTSYLSDVFVPSARRMGGWPAALKEKLVATTWNVIAEDTVAQGAARGLVALPAVPLEVLSAKSCFNMPLIEQLATRWIALIREAITPLDDAGVTSPCGALVITERWHKRRVMLEDLRVQLSSSSVGHVVKELSVNGSPYGDALLAAVNGTAAALTDALLMDSCYSVIRPFVSQVAEAASGSRLLIANRQYRCIVHALSLAWMTQKIPFARIAAMLIATSRLIVYASEGNIDTLSSEEAVAGTCARMPPASCGLQIRRESVLCSDGSKKRPVPLAPRVH